MIRTPGSFGLILKSWDPEKKDIPLEVLIDGKVHKDMETVFGKWCDDLHDLCSSKPDSELLGEHKSEVNILEINMLDPLYNSNEFLNRNLSWDEIENSVNRGFSDLAKAATISLKIRLIFKEMFVLFNH